MAGRNPGLSLCMAYYFHLRMARIIDQIKAPIEADLAAFDQHFKKSLKSNTVLLDRVTRYIVRRKGKQMRPMLVLLCARTLGQPDVSSYRAASLVELLHTATLVHDDVVDDAETRRGFFSINALWKNKIAVLVGDYLLSRGLLLALRNDDYQLLQIMSYAVEAMSEGELLQIEKARRLDIKEDVYYDIIRQKTASLIAAACSAGAASVSSDPVLIEDMRQFGEDLGMAFQLRDDLLDYGTEDIGKPVGIDIREKKMTLPIIYTLRQAPKAQKKWIIRTIKSHNEDTERVRALVEYVREQGGLAYTRQVMDDYRDRALARLQAWPVSSSRDALEQLVHYAIARKK